MFTNILLAVDGSEASLEAAWQGIALAKAINAKVTVVVVTVPWATYFARELAVVVPDIVFPEADYEERRHSRAARLLSEVEAHARQADVAVKGVHRSHRAPSRAILDVAEHEACDAIVMAPHGERGMARMLLGSETMRLVTHANIPVLVHLGAKQQERAANVLAVPRGRRETLR
jgi:nucleotide-binding universal stress UspA family protein